MGQSDAALGHHLDEVTEAQFKCDVPSHTQNDDLFVKVPSLEQILCRGRFRHPQLLQDTEPFNSLHQNPRDMLANSSLVITLLKEEIHVLAHAQPLTVEIFERIQAVRRRIYDSDDYQEGIRSFFEKRKPVFQGK
jgi:hypothetical protein